jgi:dTDP-L-rhamnose 4-epimerase
MKKVLVTGGAGFIGSHLIPKILAQGMSVRVLDVLSPQVHGDLPYSLEWLSNPNIEFIRGTVTSSEDWIKALPGISIIIHLAAETGTAQSMYELVRYNEANSQGTALMFDALSKIKNHSVQAVLLTSSRSVYGEGSYMCSECDTIVSPNARSLHDLQNERWEPSCPICIKNTLTSHATHEDDRILPASIYAATKYAQEDLVRVACQSMGLGYGIFRLQNVYGERQSLNNPYTGILSIFSTKIRLGKELTLFEDGKESRDFIHVDDVTDVLSKCLEKSFFPNTVINVGSGKGTSVKEVATELSLAFDQKPNLRITGQFRMGDIRHNFADITRLNKLLELTPKIGLKEGLSRFAAWVKTQPIPEDKLDRANQELRERKLMG